MSKKKKKTQNKQMTDGQKPIFTPKGLLEQSHHKVQRMWKWDFFLFFRFTQQISILTATEQTGFTFNCIFFGGGGGTQETSHSAGFTIWKNLERAVGYRSAETAVDYFRCFKSPCQPIDTSGDQSNVNNSNQKIKTQHCKP